MNRLFKLFLITVLLILGCESQYSKPMFVTTAHPVAEILREIVGTKGEVVCIVPIGESPHTFSPKPSDVYKVQSAKSLIYVSELFDGWAASIDSKNKIKLIDLIPYEYLLTFDDLSSHDHDGHDGHSTELADNDSLHQEKVKKEYDPHFWTDPIIVKAILPILVDTLSKIAPEMAQTFKNNASTFEKRLDVLNRQIQTILENQVGKSVFSFHPSFRYFIKRYNLKYAGSIQVSPGKEPTPVYLSNIIQKIKESGSKAIFTEPQLANGAAKVISEAAGVLLYELDPIGGVEGRQRYSDLLLYNAKTLQKALP